MKEGSAEPRCALVPAGVPGVTVAVAVAVAEVVGLPGLRRDDDGNVVDSEHSWGEDEWGVADSPARRGQLREVDAAGPRADRNLASACSLHGAEVHWLRHRGTSHDVVRAKRRRVGACPVDLHRDRRDVVGEHEARNASRAVALSWECRDDGRTPAVGHDRFAPFVERRVRLIRKWAGRRRTQDDRNRRHLCCRFAHAPTLVRACYE